MKRTQFFIWLFLLAGVIAISACQNDDLAEPNGVRITFKAVTGNEDSADTLILEEAFIGVQAIDLKRDGEADSAAVEKIVYNGPYVVDLLSGTISPAIRWIFAEPGYYTEIEVSTYSALPLGKSIVLKGTILPAGGQEKIPFEFNSSRVHNLLVKNTTGITIREGEDVDILVVFDLSDLFRGIDLNKLDRNEQGVVVISEDRSTRTAASLISSFASLSSFGIDNGLPFPQDDPVNQDNEVPGETETPEENNNNDDGEPEGGSDDEEEDNSSGGETDNSDSGNGGSADEDENEGSAGGDGDSSNNSGNENEENPGSATGDEETDDDSSNDGDEQDSGSGNQDEDETDTDDGEDDGDEGDDDNGDDEENGDEENDDEEDKSDDDDDEKDKGNRGKGNKGKSDRGKKN